MYEHCGIEVKKILERSLTQEEIDGLTNDILRRSKGDRSKMGQAADELAEQKIIEKKIAKRNAALNLRRKIEISDYVTRVWPDKPELGLQAVLVGVNRARQGGRNSVAAAQNAKVQGYTQGFMSEVEKTGYWSEFVDGSYDDDIAEAVFKLGRGENIDGHGDVAKAIAPVIEKWNEISRTDANRAGAWIGKEAGYIVRQSHDSHKIRQANRRVKNTPSTDPEQNYTAWRDTIMPLLDMDRTFKNTEGMNQEKFMRSVWEGLATGVHLAHSPDAGKHVPAGFASMAKRMSHDRVLHFKDGKSWAEYNKIFGNGSLRESMLFGLERSARNTSIMEGLGPNPQMVLDDVFDSLQKFAAERGIEGREKFAKRRNAIDNWMAEIDGSINLPANKMGAQIGANTRALQSMAKLGGAVISSVTDIVQLAGEFRYQGMGFLDGYATAISTLTSGRSTSDQKQILGMLGVQMRGMAGTMIHRYSAEDDLGGVMSSMMRTYFKYNLLTPWTDSLRKGAAFAFSKNLADNVGKRFDGLNPDLQRVMGLFGIDDGMWNMMRKVNLDKADGDSFFTPEMARRVDDADLEAYLKGQGLKPTKPRMESLRREMETKFRTYFTDRVEYAVIEPDARVRAISKMGTRPGTWDGELWRFVMQFKSFPTAMMLKPLARDIWGRGIEEDNFAKAMMSALKSGNGEQMALAHLMVMSTALGYMAMSAKDMVKGRTPRDPKDIKTWQAAAAQGGGLGIYGDFLFGDMKNRFGGGAVSTMAGPTLGTVEDIIDIFQRVRDGDDAAAATLNTVINNAPFANLFYTRMIMDYMFLYRIKESMNPGYLKRMEKRIERDNAQEFMIKPSETVR